MGRSGGAAAATLRKPAARVSAADSLGPAAFCAAFLTSADRVFLLRTRWDPYFLGGRIDYFFVFFDVCVFLVDGTTYHYELEHFLMVPTGGV